MRKSSKALFHAKHQKPHRPVGAISYEEAMATTLMRPLPGRGLSPDEAAPWTRPLPREATLDEAALDDAAVDKATPWTKPLHG